MSLHYLAKSKIQIFCRYSAYMEENANKLHFMASNFVIHPQILIFSVFKIASFPTLIANKFFHVTVFSLVYFYHQFVAPELRHSRRHCSVCQQSTWYSVTRTRFFGEQLAILNTENIKICGWITKLEAINMQFVCIFLHICWIPAEKLNF